MTPRPRPAPGHLIADCSKAGAASILEEFVFADPAEYAAAFVRVAERLEALLVCYERQRELQMRRLSPLDVPPSKN